MHQKTRVIATRVLPPDPVYTVEDPEVVPDTVPMPVRDRYEGTLVERVADGVCQILEDPYVQDCTADFILAVFARVRQKFCRR